MLRFENWGSSMGRRAFRWPAFVAVCCGHVAKVCYGQNLMREPSAMGSMGVI